MGILYLFATPQKALARGVRNNNPGNIRYSPSNEWRGQAGQDESGFVIFSTPHDGIRAMARLLINYQARAGLDGVGGRRIDTVREIITRWAPPEENDTEAYIQSMANATGLDPDRSINISAILPSLIPAMIRHENGSNPYPKDVIFQGIALA